MTTNAKNLVSDEMVELALATYFNHGQAEFNRTHLDIKDAMGKAIEAIALMLIQAADVHQPSRNPRQFAQATDGGRNPHYEGCFEGETQEQADARRYSVHVITPDDLVEVTRRDANNFCVILRLLGMEEDGDPVAWVKDQLAQAGDAVSKPVAWRSNFEEFAQYVERNYNGTVVFDKPRWHAERLWRAAKYALMAESPHEDGKDAAAAIKAIDAHYATIQQNAEDAKRLKALERAMVNFMPPLKRQAVWRRADEILREGEK